MKMKKFFLAVLTGVLIISTTICVSAASKEINVYLDGFLGVDGQKIKFDVPPQIINDRTMIPIRAVFESMGASVEWDKATQTAIGTKNGTTVKMTLNSTTEYINGTAYEMDVPPVIINGRTLAPARYVAEAFGYNVKWDEATKSVLISKDSNYDISQVIDGTRERPFRLGSTITFDFWCYDEAHGNCTLTLNEYLTADGVREKFGELNIFKVNKLDCITGHIKLNEYSSSEACSDIIYNAEAVTSKLKPLGNYSWYNDFSNLSSYGVELYSGGETDCYIQIHTEGLTEGETVDYFTITYRSGSGYDDKKTIWFSLK